MAMTAEERLEEVETAITKILYSGQSYQIGSRKLTRADLGMLRQMQKELKAELASGNNTGLFGDTYVAVFDGR